MAHANFENYSTNPRLAFYFRMVPSKFEYLDNAMLTLSKQELKSMRDNWNFDKRQLK